MNRECVGCGACCYLGTCEFSAQRTPHTRCAELVFRDGRFWCGAYERADDKTRADMANRLRFGRGCDRPDKRLPK